MSVAGVNLKSAAVTAAIVVLALRFIAPVRDFALGK